MFKCFLNQFVDRTPGCDLVATTRRDPRLTFASYLGAACKRSAMEYTHQAMQHVHFDLYSIGASSARAAFDQATVMSTGAAP